MIEFISGIGIFLFGISQIEYALRDLGSTSLTNTIARHANMILPNNNGHIAKRLV